MSEVIQAECPECDAEGAIAPDVFRGEDVLRSWYSTHYMQEHAPDLIIRRTWVDDDPTTNSNSKDQK